MCLTIWLNSQMILDHSMIWQYGWIAKKFLTIQPYCQALVLKCVQHVGRVPVPNQNRRNIMFLSFLLLFLWRPLIWSNQNLSILSLNCFPHIFYISRVFIRLVIIQKVPVNLIKQTTHWLIVYVTGFEKTQLSYTMNLIHYLLAPLILFLVLYTVGLLP